MPRLSVAERRVQLIAAAFRVIARGGVEAVTTRAICAEAGMALASFHYAFTSRDELLAAVVAGGTSVELEAVTLSFADFAATSGTVEELLRSGFLGYLDSVIADPDRERAMIALNQYAQRSKQLTDLAARMYQRYYEIAELALTEGARLGGFAWRRPVSELAPLVIALTDGLTMAYLATGDLVVCNRIIDAAVIVFRAELTQG